VPGFPERTDVPFERPTARPAAGGSETTDAMVDLAAIVESAQALEPLPASLARLAALVSDEDADLREIVEVISFDQALTGNLLRRANSASAAGRNPIRTVHEAVVRLGTSTVLALAMSASLSRRMMRPIPEYGLAEGALWRNSVRAALAADAIRGAAKAPVPAEASTAALLHDVGKLVLCRFLGPGVLQLLNAAQELDGLSMLEAERLILHVNHGELGGLVAQHWRLPESIVRAISHHHEPSAMDEPIGYAVHLANLVAHHLQGEPDVEAEQREVSLAQLRIPSKAWEQLCTTVGGRYDQLSERYS
jgi:HD-like signal output (HDOD) protein